MSHQYGMTLIELMIVIVIIGLLAVVASPFTAAWLHEAQVNEAKSLLHRAHSEAKAVALRNPDGVVDNEIAASVTLDDDNGVIVVCEGAAGGAGCTDGGSAMTWRSDWPGGVSSSVTEIEINNRGQIVVNNSPVSGGVTYILSKGAVTDNDTDYNRLR